MRVLCILPTPPPYAGPEVIGARLVAALPGAGIEVVHVRANVQRTNERKGQITAGTLLALVRIVVATIRAAVVERPALAYFNLSQNLTGFARDALLILLCRFLRLPVVVHMHGGDFATFYANRGRAMRMLIRFVLRRLAGIILLADRFRPQFAQLVAPERQFVVYNAVERDLFAGAERRYEAARDAVTVLYVGHLSRAKGFADAMRVVPKVLARFPNVRFHFAGEWVRVERNVTVPAGDAAESLVDAWNDLAQQFPDRVRLLGSIAGEEKERAFREADIFFFPSYSEGFPVVVLEAMAASLPLVGTRPGALAEVLQEGVHGCFAEPGDVDAFAAAIAELASAPERRRELGLRNRAEVVARFSIEEHLERLAAIFRGAARVSS